jgi:hypothetical protein
MRTIKCTGYRGHKCGKKARATSNRQKRCPDCAIEANRINERILLRAWYKAKPASYHEAERIRKRNWMRARRKASPEAACARQRARYRVSPGSRRESSWRSIGIITEDGNTLTYKKFKRDSKKGCKFKFLGNCYGTLGADHDHETGLYRGPLCLNHNHALGKLGDSPKNLRKLAKILESKP